MKKLFATLFATAALSVGAAPAIAAPIVVLPGGLVNVVIGDVTVTVPIRVAANLCDININVLATQFKNGNPTCTATAS